MILLDTDFLISCIKYKIDFMEEFKYKFHKIEIVILDKNIEELTVKKSSNARTALSILRVKKVRIIKTNKEEIADNLILETVDKGDIVATLDRELKRKLKDKDIRTITIRQKKYIS